MLHTWTGGPAGVIDPDVLLVLLVLVVFVVGCWCCSYWLLIYIGVGVCAFIGEKKIGFIGQ